VRLPGRGDAVRQQQGPSYPAKARDDRGPLAPRTRLRDGHARLEVKNAWSSASQRSSTIADPMDSRLQLTMWPGKVSLGLVLRPENADILEKLSTLRASAARAGRRETEPAAKALTQRWAGSLSSARRGLWCRRRGRESARNVVVFPGRLREGSDLGFKSGERRCRPEENHPTDGTI